MCSIKKILRASMNLSNMALRAYLFSKTGNNDMVLRTRKIIKQ